MALDPGRFHIAPCPTADVERLRAALGVARPTAEALVRRGYADPTAAHAFLTREGACHDPFLLGDVAAACERIERAIAAGERVCVHGDYDVDGIAATALAVLVLGELGAAVEWHLPNRFEEGYGIASETVDRLAADGVGLLLTVDCGITGAEQVARAASLGLDAIVTDHHRPGDVLPECPRVCTRPSQYPFPELCGTGVVYKLAQALDLRRGGDGAAFDRHLDLVALATVADVVPLVDENRGLVRAGLRRLARTDKVGLRALMATARVDRPRVASGDVGFRLAPRINAAGRLCHPAAALELILTGDEVRARELAGELERLNRERQAVEDEIVRDAVEQVEARDEAWRARKAYVLHSRDWHEGVIGIVASRLVERYCRPVVLIAERDGEAKGSGRSIGPYDLHAGLAAASEHLWRFGGHRAAAGLTIAPDRIDAFASDLAAHAGGVLDDEHLRPVHRIDVVAAPAELSLELADELARLEPFGLGNPQVTLLAPAAELGDVAHLGEGRHLAATVSLGGYRCRAVGFRQGASAERLRAPGRYDVAFRLERNEWNGAVSPRMLLRAALPAPEGEAPPVDGLCATPCDDRCPVRAPAFEPAAATAGPPVRLAVAGAGTVHDARGGGLQIATIARLVASGENTLVLVADVRRRRRMLTGALDPRRFGARAAYLFSERCSAAAIGERLERVAAAGVLALADYPTAAAQPRLLDRFRHVVALDPPPGGVTDPLLRAGPTAHMAWGPAEAEFALQVNRAELDLRPALADAYRLLRELPPDPPAEELERALAGSGRYPRTPQACARIVDVLTELRLIELTLDLPGCRLLQADRTDLDRSPTYRACAERLGAIERALAAELPGSDAARAA